MREDFLHFLWRSKRFDLKNLHTTQGEPVQILHPGQYNHLGGPDFESAKIRVGNTTWAGNLEIHTKASEWLRHGHHRDEAYDNVVLHVVYEEDTPICRNNGTRIPCLELKGRIPPGLLANYQRLIAAQHWIPCQNFLREVPQHIFRLWLDRCLVDRLETKTGQMRETLAITGNNYEETFFIYLARAFGQKNNALPFEHLAKITPAKLLAKHKNSLFQIEALLFGQAGLLEEEFQDIYPRKLQAEYQFLRNKYQLTSLNKVCWKVGRLRPANFPTIRIAQLASLVFQSENLLSKVLAARNIQEILNLFDVQLSNYWWDHYVFDTPSKRRKKRLGKAAVQGLIVNTIVPFTFLYGQLLGIERFRDNALTLLASVPPEKNQIIIKWEEMGIRPTSAYETQALLHLKKKYCQAQQCLKCAVGNSILKDHGVAQPESVRNATQ